MQQTKFSDSILNNIRNVQEIKDNLLDYTTQMNDKESNKRLEELQERIEELQEYIDVMKETQVEQVVRNGHKIHRNDPCPCGSGKKYKKCCGKSNI